MHLENFSKMNESKFLLSPLSKAQNLVIQNSHQSIFWPWQWLNPNVHCGWHAIHSFLKLVKSSLFQVVSSWKVQIFKWLMSLLACSMENCKSFLWSTSILWTFADYLIQFIVINFIVDSLTLGLFALTSVKIEHLKTKMRSKSVSKLFWLSMFWKELLENMINIKSFPNYRQ